MALTDSQFKGNWGELFIASELAAKGCLVRHVTQGHDTGVDLYCETTWNGIPFLHFWCQVKTKKKISVRKETIAYSPKKKKHIDYWLKQPVPVFIFIVPSLLRDKQLNKPYYICTPLRNRNGATMTSFFKVMHSNDLHRFLYDKLIVITQEWDAKDGRLNAIKRPDASEVHIGFEPGMTLPFKKEILRSIRWGLWRLIDDNLFLGKGQEKSEKSHMFYNLPPLSTERRQRVKEVKPYVEALKCLCKNNETSHWESYYILGQYYELEKAYDGSLVYYEKALLLIDSIVKKYPNINALHSHRNDVIKAVQRVKDRLTRLRIALEPRKLKHERKAE